MTKTEEAGRKKNAGRSPERVVVDGMVVNILAHYVGYMVGFFVPAVVCLFL
jgi:hypothetical protein